MRTQGTRREKGNVYMMSTKFKRMLRAGVVAGCVAAMGCTGTLVYAEPSTEELEEQKGALENEVDSLNEEGSAYTRVPVPMLSGRHGGFPEQDRFCSECKRI